jgi:uncharacterized protein
MAGKQATGKPREGIDASGRTPLHYAAAGSKADEVVRLLAGGADANAQDDHGWTALHFAAQAVAPECAAQLLRAGADLTLRDSYGNTALFRAVFSSRGSGAVIRLLREAGADPHATNQHGVSPASLARTIANYDVAQFFSDLATTP